MSLWSGQSTLRSPSFYLQIGEQTSYRKSLLTRTCGSTTQRAIFKNDSSANRSHLKGHAITSNGICLLHNKPIIYKIVLLKVLTFLFTVPIKCLRKRFLHTGKHMLIKSKHQLKGKSNIQMKALLQLPQTSKGPILVLQSELYCARLGKQFLMSVQMRVTNSRRIVTRSRTRTERATSKTRMARR